MRFWSFGGKEEERLPLLRLYAPRLQRVSKRSSQQLCLFPWKRINPGIIPGRPVGYASAFAASILPLLLFLPPRVNAKGNISMLGYLGILQVASATAGSTQRYRSSRFPALSSDPERHLHAGPVPVLVHVPVHVLMHGH